MIDLIAAYFDRPLTPAESTELFALLENDPVSAQAFARLARADLVIEQHFATEESSRTFDAIGSMIRRPFPVVRSDSLQWLSAENVAKWGAVAAVLVFAIFVIAQLAKKPEELASKRENHAWRMLEPPGVPDRSFIRLMDGLSRAEQKAAAALRARLGRFYLPSVQIRDKTINAAVAEIEVLMGKLDHCGFLEEQPVFLAGDSQSDSERKVRLVRGNLSVLDALELLAIQSGKQLVFSAAGVEMADFTESPDAPMVTSTFDLSSSGLRGVSPYIAPVAYVVSTAVTISESKTGAIGGLIREDFQMVEGKVPFLANLPTGTFGQEEATVDLELSPEVVEFEGFVNYGSPTSPTSPTTAEDGSILTESKIIDPIFSSRGADADPAVQFDMWGLPLAGEASAYWLDPENGEKPATGLVVKAGPETMNRVTTLMAAITGTLPESALVSVEAKVFEVSESLALEDRLLNASELESFLSEIESDQGATSVSYPSVITRNAMSVVVRSTVDYPVVTGGGRTEVDQSGTVIDVVPVFEGESVRLRGSVDLGFIPDYEMTAQEKAATEHLRVFEESPVLHHKVDFDAYVGPDEAAVFSTAGTEPGTSIIYVIEAKRQ